MLGTQVQIYYYIGKIITALKEYKKEFVLEEIVLIGQLEALVQENVMITKCPMRSHLYEAGKNLLGIAQSITDSNFCNLVESLGKKLKGEDKPDS